MADGVNGGGFEGLGLAHGRQNAGQARGEHGLARAGRTREQQVVPPGRGDFKGPARLGLARDLRQVRHPPGLGRRLRRGPRQLRLPGHPCRDLAQGLGAEKPALAQEGHLAAVARGQHQGAAGLARPDGCRQRAAHRSQRTAQGQLAQELRVFEPVRRHLAGAGENAEGDGQVEASALLGQLGRREGHGDHLRRRLEARIHERCADPVPGFGHRFLRHAHDLGTRESARQMHLDGDLRRLDAHAGAAVDLGESHRIFVP